jgi:3',5'-cyclic-AMP phosphodiesterase
MKIAFVTDIHIGAEGELPAGVDVRANFERVLDRVRTTKPNCLVLGGDLCFDVGVRDIYQWVYQQLQDLPCMWFAIPGNHDDSVMMAEELHLTHHLTGNELYSAVPLDGYPALFLDSSRGVFSETQWQWLQDELAAIHHNALIFCHHPVLRADAQFMDTHYPFKEQARWLETTEELPCRMQVFSGHYHCEAIAQRANTTVFVTPSTYIQLDPYTPTIELVATQPMYREITVLPTGLTSRIVRI